MHYSLSDYIDQLLEAICIVDSSGHFIYLSPASERIFGYEPSELIGRQMLELVHPDDRERTLQVAVDIMAGKPQFDFENRYLHKQGHIVHVQWSARWHAKDQVRVAVARDITRHKALLHHLQNIAFFDPLTQLPNRALFKDRLLQAIARAQREHSLLALLFVDLDRFKAINDQFGHAAGDLMLGHVANALTHCVRDTDTVARFGGDEFVVLLNDIKSPQEALQVAQKVASTLSKPMIFENNIIPGHASIGIAIYPDDGMDELSLLDAADQAMYKVKERGGNSACFASINYQRE